MNRKEKHTGSKSTSKINKLNLEKSKNNNWDNLISSTDKLIKYLKENDEDKKENKKDM